MVNTVRLGMAGCVSPWSPGPSTTDWSRSSPTCDDDDDVDGSVKKWLSVTTEPLTGRRKAIPDDELEQYGTKRVTPATSFGAAMSAENVDRVQRLPYDHLCWISLVRDSKDNWKARDFRAVPYRLC